MIKKSSFYVENSADLKKKEFDKACGFKKSVIK
ncbi:hypothetical protein EUBDOL_02388 [Amedibacillus dolichus DSM 3991]|uniref:Uncharacterized protein n=1 Tax=Amedibacillus dolichus DSM 3991 TaxID=428127 RepID=A8RFX2_9FIRM|nr:hypothetical protein EUBDOL_02388 [Amedibacillus dolichus DSM 3991]